MIFYLHGSWIVCCIFVIVAIFLYFLYSREEYTTVRVNANEVSQDKINGLAKYLHERGYIDVTKTEKTMYAKKFYRGVASELHDGENVKFYVHGRKICDGKIFFIHIYFGKIIKIKALEQHCFEILSYLVGETRASILIN